MSLRSDKDVNVWTKYILYEYEIYRKN
jgi:hypothetical protein